MAPVVLAAELLKVLLEESAHGDDAIGHALDLTEPLLVEGGVVQDFRSNAGTVNRGVGVQWADENLDLRVDALLLLSGFADNGESTDTLAVQTLSRLVCKRVIQMLLELTMFFAKDWARQGRRPSLMK